MTDSNEGDQRNQPGFLRGALENNQEAQNQDRDEDFWNPEHINDDRNEIRTHHLFQRPSHFRERVGVLLVIVAISMSSCAASAIYFPVLIGRMILVYTVGHKRTVHEMYTVRVNILQLELKSYLVIPWTVRLLAAAALHNNTVSLGSKRVAP